MTIRLCQLLRSALLPALLVVAAGHYAAGQPRPEVKADSLRRALAAAPPDTVRVKLLFSLVRQTVERQPAEAMTYAQQALAEAKQLGWQRGQADALGKIAALYFRQGNFPLAQQYSLTALNLWRALRQERQALVITRFVAEILASNKQFAEALELENKVIAGARVLHDTLLLTRAYMNLGLFNSWQQRPATALPYYEQSLDLMKGMGKTKKNTEFINAISPIILNNVADAHIELNEPKKALAYLLQAQRLVHERGQDYDEQVIQLTLAQAYAKLKNWPMATYHALRAHQFSESTRSTPFLIAANNLLDTLYAQQGDYRLARRYLAENRALEAQARTQEQERKVAEQQSRYDVQERERNIKLLTQQNQIAHLAALQQRTLRNAAVVIALLLLIAVGILYNRYRLRQRTVQLLDEQNRDKELLLREKTLLLQEVHHRVKNNLQIVLSLLNSQLDTLPDPVAAAALRESQSRVQTMALIHQNLYQSESLARVDMRRYLAELLAAIGRAFRREEVAVQLVVTPVHLTTHTAVPLGLIVNELVTNAYKYAFAGRAHNELLVELVPAGPTAYRLVVADNGIGLPPLDLAVVQSLGLRLTAGLLRQLHAQVVITRAPGTRFSITFSQLAGTGAAGPGLAEEPVADRGRVPNFYSTT